MPAPNTKNSREADKFVVRLPDGYRDRVAEVSRQGNRSMNDTMVLGTELVLGLGERQEILMQALERELHAQEQLTAELRQMRAEVANAHGDLRSAWERNKTCRTSENTRQLEYEIERLMDHYPAEEPA